MYLCRLVLNPRSRQVQAELADPYQMHRTLSKAFGDGDDIWRETRVLFRVDKSDQGRKLHALVQSRHEPNWSNFAAVDGYLLSEPQTKRLELALQPGQKLAFRLRANPTVKLKCPDKPNGLRKGIYDETGRLEWLNRKGQAGGFRVLEARIVSEGTQTGITANGSNTVFAAALFEGILEVADPVAFARTVESGLGSAKAFGFGMLSIAPIGR